MQSEEKRTASEINLVASKVDTRYSLSAKIFGWSEKRFWQQWYRIYKRSFAAQIHEKSIRVVGATSSQWRKLTRENIIMQTDPDVRIDVITSYSIHYTKLYDLIQRREKSI